MRLSVKKAPMLQLFIGIVSLFIFGSVCRAGNPYSAYYHWSGSRLFWFLIISDLHIGTSGSQDTAYLSWAVTEARDVIAPSFIVATGDLTDSTNGGVIPNGPYTEEWEAYRQILDAAGVDASSYYDIPGNHDHYNDQTFAYYRTYSIQGSAEDTTQHSWIRQFPFGTYHFIGTCTAGNDGASFSIWPVVLITAPVDRCLGDCPQPFAYELPQGRANPIRALVFDKNPVTRVQFRLDADPTWQPMQPVGEGPLWVGFWDSTLSAYGAHSIEVQAEGSTIAGDRVDTFIDPDLCMGDSEGDGDVDGSDLAKFADNFLPEVLPDMASSFGRNNCP